MSCWGTSGKSEFGNLIPAIRDLGERSLNISAVLSFELEESQNVSSGDGCHLGPHMGSWRESSTSGSNI